MTYSFPAGALLYCRTCQDLRQHFEVSPTHLGCEACGRKIHVAEVVATYSADEYDDPAPILLPWRLLPEQNRVERMKRSDEFTPIGGEYRLTNLDKEILVA